MDEDKRKHLEFIQATINRMAQNSFLIKGWTVTLVSALFALAEKDSNKMYASVAYFPVIIFYLLDTYYLYQEKCFRYLYDDVAANRLGQYTMSTRNTTKKSSYWVTTISISIWPFYLVTFLTLCIVMLVI